MTDSKLLVGKILVSFVPGMGVTIIGFLLYTATVDLLTYSIFEAYILTTVSWIVLIFILSPTISLLGNGITVMI